MFKFQRKACTSETTGKIIKKKWNGKVWFVWVEYVVDGNTFRKSEMLKRTTTKVHKIGKIPIGMQYRYSISNFEVGTELDIRYNPRKPQKAYIIDNVGVGIC